MLEKVLDVLSRWLQFDQDLRALDKKKGEGLSTDTLGKVFVAGRGQGEALAKSENAMLPTQEKRMPREKLVGTEWNAPERCRLTEQPPATCVTRQTYTNQS